MEISPNTKIDDLLNAYPSLIDFFIQKSPRYQHLKNPIMRKTIGKVATLKQVAAMGDFELESLLSEIEQTIQKDTNQRPSADKDPSAVGAEKLRTPEERQKILKNIILDLHKGEDIENLKTRFRELIKDVDPSEIAGMEQKLIDEGMPETEVKRLCDVHVAVFKESLDKQEIPRAPAGHPIHTLSAENRAAEEIMDNINQLLSDVGDPPDEKKFADSAEELQKLIAKLAQIDLHYLKKENQLFPLLETHGISGPSQVMWAIHDDIRADIKKVKQQQIESTLAEMLSALKNLLTAIREMIYKEENILYPMSLKTLSESDWLKVKHGESEIGYAWIEPAGDWRPEVAEESEKISAKEKIHLDTGGLVPEQINMMLTHLPVDITFVDENDRVAYYSQGKERIFPRSPGIIGREVQKCHPPKSLHLVNQILEKFRSGERDVAEFWIQMKGRFIHIRYFAVRDQAGSYKGCLEVSQDVTEIRQLEGEKRLVNWQ
ncbi:MAG: DUF438 domain-containing protein [Deltaproteobacteria bacterium]|nr:MAG: DUF438 domain-containing protein [Deltaproteobacteria bacterium]